ncbi:MAG: hypothetical protein RL097_445 [Candidatus Parcubacteria bacterium]
MHHTLKSKRRTQFALGLLTVALIACGFFNTLNKPNIANNNSNEVSPKQINDVTTTSTGTLAVDDCSAEIPIESTSDSVLNLDGTATIYWRDQSSATDTVKVFPFDPKTDFSGCSDSVRRKLREMNEVAKEVYGDEYEFIFMQQ